MKKNHLPFRLPYLGGIVLKWVHFLRYCSRLPVTCSSHPTFSLCAVLSDIQGIYPVFPKFHFHFHHFSAVWLASKVSVFYNSLKLVQWGIPCVSGEQALFPLESVILATAHRAENTVGYEFLPFLPLQALTTLRIGLSTTRYLKKA